MIGLVWIDQLVHYFISYILSVITTCHVITPKNNYTILFSIYKDGKACIYLSAKSAIKAFKRQLSHEQILTFLLIFKDIFRIIWEGASWI